VPTASDLHRAGADAMVDRRLPAARRLLSRARALSDDPDLTARIDATEASLGAELGDLDGALARCDRALATDGITAETRGVLHSQRAWILLRKGETAAALEAFGLGIEAMSDPMELGKAHINRGTVLLSQGSAALAADDFATAMRLLDHAGVPVEGAMARHNLGYASFLQGDLVTALQHMDNVRPVLVPQSPVLGAICNQDRAEVLMAAGLTRSGLAALDESARTLGAHRLAQRRAETELTIARASLGSDPVRALAVQPVEDPRPPGTRRGVGARGRGAARAYRAGAARPGRCPGRGALPAGDAVVGHRQPAGRRAGRGSSR
jgi:tetratricopeptide (TPR) repeat protein